MSYPITNVLSEAKKLMDASKFREAINVISGIEGKKVLRLQDLFEIHFLKGSLFVEIGYMNEALKYIELAYNESIQLKNKLLEIDVLLKKSNILSKSDRRTEAFKVIKKIEQLMNTITQISSAEFKEKSAFLMLERGSYYFNNGELNQSLEYATKSLAIGKELENKKLIMHANKLLAFNYGFKGDIERAYECHKYTLTLAEELNDKQEVIGAFNSIGMYFTEKGDYNQAIDYLEKGLSLCEEIQSFKTIVVLSSLFDAYYYSNSLDKAQECLSRMKNVADSHSKDDALVKFYRLAKATMLKKEEKRENHLKAKEKLKKFIDEENPFSGLYFPALIDLCDTFLIILGETGDLKTLEEMNPYIDQLKIIAKQQKSSWLLVETLILEAKLSLLTFEFHKAKNILAKALGVAEKYGQERLTMQILEEQRYLSENFLKWEKLKSSGAKISARMKLARIDEQIELLLQKRKYLENINDKS